MDLDKKKHRHEYGLKVNYLCDYPGWQLPPLSILCKSFAVKANIMTRICAGQPRSHGSIPGRNKGYFPFFQNVQTSFIVKEVSYSLGTKSTLPRGKWPGHKAGNSHLVPRLRMHSYTSIPSCGPGLYVKILYHSATVQCWLNPWKPTHRTLDWLQWQLKHQHTLSQDMRSCWLNQPHLHVRRETSWNEYVQNRSVAHTKQLVWDQNIFKGFAHILKNLDSCSLNISVILKMMAGRNIWVYVEKDWIFTWETGHKERHAWR
jgi:hypothetical protein